MKKAIWIALIATTAAATMAGCASVAPEQQVIIIDGPEYTSVDQLAAAATLVVNGHFVAEVTAVSEGELNGRQAGGLPMELWSFVIDEVISGDADLLGSTIQVSQLAVDADGAVRPATADATALLFLKPYPSGAFAIVGLGAGTIYVDDDGLLTVPDGESVESIDAAVSDSSD
jgi:hypothetical protein